MKKAFNVTASSIYPLGVCFVPDGLHISMVCNDREECGILLFDRSHKEGQKIPFPDGLRKGSIYSMLLKGYHNRDCSYLFYSGEKIYQDPYALALENNRKYGEIVSRPARCKVYDGAYDWEDDRPLKIPYEDSIFYMLHVRGFTKHRSSGVRCKGTYAGVVEKIPYLKSLGITAALLMPAYEFDEVFHEDKRNLNMEQAPLDYKEILEESSEGKEAPVRVNYWGYQEGLYMMPKYAYSYDKDAIKEFKDMVKALHKNGIEVMMQFYLPPELPYIYILDILNRWVLEYHLDGFQLMGVDVPMQMLCREPLFAETKLIGERDFCLKQENKTSGKDNVNVFRNFGYLNDSFLYEMRKFIKGDSNMIESLISLCRMNASDRGIVNYIARQDGFRLADMVSYNAKYNEANGENNNDGISQNYSWNCGIEGKTRKKNILKLRMCQMKNAMTLVLLSQGTPLIYSGDEFGNTQEGNNNPYCQDNPVCWIKWNMFKANEELFKYTRELIALRKKYKILHFATPLRGMDYLSCGYPDISFHGRDAWKPDTSSESRSLGIMYCCKYGKDADEKDDTFIYIGINMHWETHKFGLPQMPKDLEWVRLYSTTDDIYDIERSEGKESEDIHNVVLLPRTISIYITRKRKEINGTTRKRPEKPVNKVGKDERVKN